MKFTDFIFPEDSELLWNLLLGVNGVKPVECECRIAHRNGRDSMF